MKKIILINIICIYLLSCTKNKEKDTYEYFRDNIYATMTYHDLLKKFGEADADIGSGIHIYVYNLSDGSKIFIGYTDHVHYANHNAADGTLLHVII